MSKIHNLGIKFLHLLEAPFTEIGTLLFENNYFGLFHVQTFLWMRSCFRGRFLSHHYTVTLKTMTPVANFCIILCEIFYNLSKAFILGVIRQLGGHLPNFDPLPHLSGQKRSFFIDSTLCHLTPHGLSSPLFLFT